MLATNRESALDEAFLRRLRFIVRFELPDARLRKRLWQRSFPPEAAHDGLDWDALARGELAGGEHPDRPRWRPPTWRPATAA